MMTVGLGVEHPRRRLARTNVAVSRRSATRSDARGGATARGARRGDAGAARTAARGWSFFARASLSLTRARASSRTVADSSEFALSRTSRVATTRSSASVSSSPSATRVGATAHGEEWRHPIAPRATRAESTASQTRRSAETHTRPLPRRRPLRRDPRGRLPSRAGRLAGRSRSLGKRGLARLLAVDAKRARARARLERGRENAARNALSVDLKSSLSSSRPRGEAKSSD